MTEREFDNLKDGDELVFVKNYAPINGYPHKIGEIIIVKEYDKKYASFDVGKGHVLYKNSGDYNLLACWELAEFTKTPLWKKLNPRKNND